MWGDGVSAYRRIDVSVYRLVGVSALATPMGYENLAQGGGFAEPWVNFIRGGSP